MKQKYKITVATKLLFSLLLLLLFFKPRTKSRVLQKNEKENNDNNKKKHFVSCCSETEVEQTKYGKRVTRLLFYHNMKLMQ